MHMDPCVHSGAWNYLCKHKNHSALLEISLIQLHILIYSVHFRSTDFSEQFRFIYVNRCSQTRQNDRKFEAPPVKVLLLVLTLQPGFPSYTSLTHLLWWGGLFFFLGTYHLKKTFLITFCKKHLANKILYSPPCFPPFVAMIVLSEVLWQEKSSQNV